MVNQSNPERTIRASEHGRHMVMSLLLALVTAGCLPSTPPDVAHQLPNRDLRVDPVRVDHAALRILTPAATDGNALLIAQVAASEDLPARVDFLAGDQVVALRDDGVGGDDTAGDRIFSAVVHVSGSELAAEKAIAEEAARQEVVTLFQGRQRVQLPFSSLAGNPESGPFAQAQTIGLLPLSISPLDAAPSIDRKRSLMITDLSVVEDPARTFNPCTGIGKPGGKWTFQHLMTEMANQSVTGVDPAEFVLRWLHRWDFTQVINDFTVLERGEGGIDSLISQWPKLSDGRLDLSRAPFRLLAIVNRFDLRANLLYGGGSTGEARFVFGVTDPLTCQPLPFTVIFEYGIQSSGCADQRKWAQQWADLSSILFGDDYNAALEAITEQFASANAAPDKPNGSALNQLRTNEIALGSPWELREFKIFDSDSDAHLLREVTVNQTPDLSLNGTDTLVEYALAHSAEIVADRDAVPLEFPFGSSFLGGNAPAPGVQFFWSGPGISSNYPLRSHLSLHTCNGCHAGETQTVFTHISPRSAGAEAALSPFLTGERVDDPAGSRNATGAINAAEYGDLENRENDLRNFLGRTCLTSISFMPLRMPH